jgi:hypothetical protein
MAGGAKAAPASRGRGEAARRDSGRGESGFGVTAGAAKRPGVITDPAKAGPE